MFSGAAFLTRIEVPKIMVSVLPFLKFKEMSLSVSQLRISRISPFSFFWINSESFSLTQITVLSAYLIILEWPKNHVGPRMDPCGTPLKTGKAFDK